MVQAQDAVSVTVPHRPPCPVPSGGKRLSVFMCLVGNVTQVWMPLARPPAVIAFPGSIPSAFLSGHGVAVAGGRGDAHRRLGPSLLNNALQPKFGFDTNNYLT